MSVCERAGEGGRGRGWVNGSWGRTGTRPAVRRTVGDAPGLSSGLELYRSLFVSVFVPLNASATRGRRKGSWIWSDSVSEAL